MANCLVNKTGEEKNLGLETGITTEVSNSTFSWVVLYCFTLKEVLERQILGVVEIEGFLKFPKVYFFCFTNDMYFNGTDYVALFQDTCDLHRDPPIGFCHKLILPHTPHYHRASCLVQINRLCPCTSACICCRVFFSCLTLSWQLSLSLGNLIGTLFQALGQVVATSWRDLSRISILS